MVRRNDFKYIIIRVIIGVLISVILLFLKQNVFALSCDVAEVENIQVFAGGVDSRNTNQNTSNYYYTINAQVDFASPISISTKGHDFVRVYVPVFSNIVFNSDYQRSGDVDVLTTGNALIPVNGPWIYGDRTNTGYTFDIYKNDSFKAIVSRVTGFNLNFNAVGINTRVDGSWRFSYYDCDSNSDVTNAINENTEAVQETNDTLKDDSVDNDKASSDIDSMKDKVASNGSITQLLTLPITLYQSVLNSANGSCSPWNLGSLLGTNLVLPCIDLSKYLGGALFGIIDVLLSGLFILTFRKKMVDIFNHMTSLNDRGNELE